MTVVKILIINSNYKELKEIRPEIMNAINKRIERLFKHNPEILGVIHLTSGSDSEICFTMFEMDFCITTECKYSKENPFKSIDVVTYYLDKNIDCTECECDYHRKEFYRESYSLEEIRYDLAIPPGVDKYFMNFLEKFSELDEKLVLKF